MKWRKGLLYLGLAAGGVGYVARGMKKSRKLQFWRILWGVFWALVLLSIFIMSQVFTKADSFFWDEIDGCAVVFGAAVWKDDQPSWALSDRMQAGIDLYQNNQVNCLVLSGGDSTFGDHEVDVMQRLAREAGISQSDLKLDYNGYNTLATITNLPNDIESFVFVSNDFHMARIALIATRKGVKNFELHAAPYQQGRYLKNDQYFVREIGGYSLIWLGLW